MKWVSFGVVLVVVAWPLAVAEEKDPRPARIVGGDLVDEGKYPYYCVTSPGALCGCSLIYPDVIMTAAHCRGHLENTNIYIGGIRADRTDAKDVIKAGTELVHPRFNPVTLDNDIMLVKLTRRSSIPPVRWNTDPDIPKTNEILTAIGMGKTGSTSPRAEFLLQVDVPVLDQTTCIQKYGSITRNMFCAGGEVGKDSCFGDSGSPILDSDGLMVGVVSWGPTGGCGLDGMPGVYARTSTSVSFIRQGICSLASIRPSYCSGSENPPPVSTEVPVSPPSPLPIASPPTPALALNDACTSSHLLATQKGAITGTTWEATADTGSPVCGRASASSADLPGVWYRVVGTGSIVQVDTCGTDSQMILYKANDGCSDLTCIRGSRDGCGDRAGSVIKWQSVYGESYRLLVQTVWPTEFTIQLSVILGPPNPVCLLATQLELSSVISGSTVGGAWVYPANQCGVDPSTSGVWYQVVGSGRLLLAKVLDTNFASKISIYEGPSCSDIECIETVGSRAPEENTTARWQSQPGRSYWIAVHGIERDYGDFRFTIEETGPEQPPPSLRPQAPSRPVISWGKPTKAEPPQPSPPSKQPPLISWGNALLWLRPFKWWKRNDGD